MNCRQTTARIGLSFALALSLLLGPAAKAAQEALSAPSESAPLTNDQQLEAAIRTINEGNPQIAMDQHLNPLIAEFEAMGKRTGNIYFSASSLTEALLYSALGAAIADKEESPRDTQVLDGTWATAVHLKGYALIEQENFDEALRVLTAGLQIAPKNPMLWNEIGAIHQAQRNWNESLQAFIASAEGAELVLEEKEKGEPNRMLARALRGQGFARIELGEFDVAEALFKRCLEMDADDRAAQHELAYIAELKKRQN